MNEIMDEILCLKAKAPIQVHIITNNYFEPSELRRSLENYKKRGDIASYFVMELYSIYQSPKGRPLQKYLRNLSNFKKILEIYIQARPKLCLFHTTTELQDLIGLKYSVRNSCVAGVLRPTSCATFESPSQLRRSKNFIHVVRTSLRKTIYYWELLQRCIVHRIILGTFDFWKNSTSAFHGSERLDFALCSHPLDVSNLTQQVNADEIVAVSFATVPPIEVFRSEQTVLIIVPLLDTKAAFQEAIDEFLSTCREIKTLQPDRIGIRHHPRSHLGVSQSFDKLIQIEFGVETTTWTSMSLSSAVDMARKVIAIGETSAGSFAFQRSPKKVIFTNFKQEQQHKEVNFDNRQKLSEYLVDKVKVSDL
jgi:hypothetical protein